VLGFYSFHTLLQVIKSVEKVELSTDQCQGKQCRAPYRSKSV